MVRIGVSGACGKMGQRIIALAQKDSDFTVVFGLEAEGHPKAGQAVDGIEVATDNARIKDCDCLIEFTSPQATLANLKRAVEFKRSMVIGTTGLSSDEQKKIGQAAKVIPVVFAPNMSVGVNLLFRLLKSAAATLKGYRVSVEEAHHIHKKDAPSGTAKRIAQVINQEGFNVKNEEIKAIREDEIVGDHKVVFESDVDRIELSHSAKTRDIFAQGALTAAKWLAGKKPGLYSMDDVLF
jgi:4-hydroxy-tetrahydrodipicolinate reductase